MESDGNVVLQAKTSFCSWNDLLHSKFRRRRCIPAGSGLWLHVIPNRCPVTWGRRGLPYTGGMHPEAPQTGFHSAFLHAEGWAVSGALGRGGVALVRCLPEAAAPAPQGGPGGQPLRSVSALRSEGRPVPTGGALAGAAEVRWHGETGRRTPEGGAVDMGSHRWDRVRTMLGSSRSEAELCGVSLDAVHTELTPPSWASLFAWTTDGNSGAAHGPPPVSWREGISCPRFRPGTGHARLGVDVCESAGAWAAGAGLPPAHSAGPRALGGPCPHATAGPGLPRAAPGAPAVAAGLPVRLELTLAVSALPGRTSCRHGGTHRAVT